MITIVLKVKITVFRGHPWLISWKRESRGEEVGKGGKGHLRVILVTIKGSAHFCFTCWASSLLTGVLFRKGI